MNDDLATTPYEEQTGIAPAQPALGLDPVPLKQPDSCKVCGGGPVVSGACVRCGAGTRKLEDRPSRRRRRSYGAH